MELREAVRVLVDYGTTGGIAKVDGGVSLDASMEAARTVLARLKEQEEALKNLVAQGELLEKAMS